MAESLCHELSGKYRKKGKSKSCLELFCDVLFDFKFHLVFLLSLIIFVLHVRNFFRYLPCP